MPAPTTLRRRVSDTKGIKASDGAVGAATAAALAPLSKKAAISKEKRLLANKIQALEAANTARKNLEKTERALKDWFVQLCTKDGVVVDKAFEVGGITVKVTTKSAERLDREKLTLTVGEKTVSACLTVSEYVEVAVKKGVEA